MNHDIITNFLAKNEYIFLNFVASCIKYGLEDGKGSNHIKYAIYNSTYPMEFRPKRTGFEKIDKLDKTVRKYLQTFVPNESDIRQVELDVINEYIEHFDEKDFLQSINDYKISLEKVAEEYRDDNNIVYLSGGIDSELVALIFLSKKINFIPVVFELFDNDHQIINDFDIEWAYKFCSQNKIEPIVRSMNVEKFWQSDNLKNIAIKNSCNSPQICTHYYMIELVQEEIETKGFAEFKNTKYLYLE